MNINNLKAMVFDFDMTLLVHPENYLTNRDEDEFLYQSYRQRYDYVDSVVTAAMKQFVLMCDAAINMDLYMFSAASSNYVLKNKERVVHNRYDGIHWREFLACYTPVAKPDTLGVLARLYGWKREEICLVDDADEVLQRTRQKGFQTIDSKIINAGKCYISASGEVIYL